MALRQSFKRRETDLFRLIYSKNNLANVMTKVSSNLVLESIISTNKAKIRFERLVK